MNDFDKHIDFSYMSKVPISYKNATNCDDASKWKLTMDAEIQSLINSSETFL